MAVDISAQGRHLAVVFTDLERHTDAWLQVPRERMAGAIAEYRYVAESLAAQYGCLYREWAGDGHMFLFESPDAAAQFGLKLIDSWSTACDQQPALRDVPELPLRLGAHFGECTRMEGEEAWIGRANAVAKRVESVAEPNTLYVTGSFLDVIDLPLYSFSEAGEHELRGDFIRRRALYRVDGFDERALAEKPADELDAEAWFLRGVSMIGTEREWTDAEAACYREAIALRPDYAEAHVNLAILSNARGDYTAAIRHYQEALKLRPDYPEGRYNYAVFLAGRGRLGGAGDHLREALRIRPDYVDAHHAYANVLASRGNESAAVSHYEEALRLRPDDAAAHADYAILLERLGDPDGATSHFQESLRIRPDPVTHYNFALLLENREERLLAELHYREAIRLWPDYGEAHNNLAILLQLRDDLEGAQRHYRAALEARPEDPETHYNYSLFLRAGGKTHEADEHLRTARELAPETATYRTALFRSE